jgi:hypothetical protein
MISNISYEVVVITSIVTYLFATGRITAWV